MNFMAHCESCGKEVTSKERFCTNCGAINENYVDPAATSANVITSENPVLGILAIVFAIFNPIVGLIISIVGLKRYVTHVNLKKCRIGLWLSIVMWVLQFIAGFIMGLLFY